MCVCGQGVSGLVEEAYRLVKAGVGVAIQQEEGGALGGVSDMQGINQAHMALVTYCDKYLRQRDEQGHQHSHSC